MFAALLLAQAVTILVGGHPLQTNPGPIEQSGRVFVPMRSIFERLGASVVYNAGVINATKGSVNVGLTIGSTRAIIDGQVQHLDVAPFIVGATTYVPLRFIAQSLGANVDYNSSTRVVAIAPAGHAPPYRPVPPPYNPPPPPPAPMIGLLAQQPAPNAYVNNRFATISAQFSRQARPGTVTVWINGNDVTYRSSVRAGGFSYTPPAAMNFGGHTIRVAGTANDGTRFDRSWSFTVNGAPTPPPSAIVLTNIQPAPGATIVDRFATISANFSRAIDPGSLRVYLDGADRTNQCGISANSFSYKPPAPLSFGTHTVRATFRGPGGNAFERSWSFTVKNQNAMHLTINQPSGTVIDRTFTVAGNTVANGRVVVTAGVTPAAAGLARGTATAGPRGNFSLSLTVSPLPGQGSVTVRVVVTDPVSSQTTEQTLQLRLR